GLDNWHQVSHVCPKLLHRGFSHWRSIKIGERLDLFCGEVFHHRVGHCFGQRGNIQVGGHHALELIPLVWRKVCSHLISQVVEHCSGRHCFEITLRFLAARLRRIRGGRNPERRGRQREHDQNEYRFLHRESLISGRRRKSHLFPCARSSTVARQRKLIRLLRFGVARLSRSGYFLNLQ